MGNNPRVLVDYTWPVRMLINESESVPGTGLVVEGKCGQCDAPTKNGRIYSRRIMEREIARLKEKIKKGAAVGSVDHPSDGKSRITDIGHIIKDVWIEDDGSIKGKFNIIEGTSKGKDLAAVLKAGVSVGMSSRGLGSTTPAGPQGHVSVGEDFKLSTFDFVVEPAVNDAFPQIFSEDVNTEDITSEVLRAKFPEAVRDIEEKAYGIAQEITENTLRADFEDNKLSTVKKYVDEAIEEQKDAIRQEVAAEERERLSDDFGVKLVRALQDQREKIEESVRSEVAADPSVAGAKLTLEKISEMVNPFAADPDVEKIIAEKDSKIAELKSLLEKSDDSEEELRDLITQTEDKARQLGYQLYVERAVAGRPDAEAVKVMVGDLDNVENPEHLKNKLVSAIKKANELQEDVNHRLESANKQTNDKISILRKQNDKYRKMVQEEKQSFVTKLDELRNSLEEKLEILDNKLIERDNEIEHERLKTKKLTEALDYSADTIEALQLRNYAENRTIGHPNRDDILKRIDNKSVTSVDEVNQLAESTDVRAQEPGGLSERMRRAFSRGREVPEEEEFLTETEERFIPELERLGIALEDIAPLGRRGK